ncbi:MAG: hypothetical protein ACOYL6_06110 [Bacteriovoracaceae bacterium]
MIKRNFALVCLILLLNACASHKKPEVKMESIVKKENPTETIDQTRNNILDILQSDPSITEDEKVKLTALVDQGFARNLELEVLANQSKALLVREYIKDNPNQKVIKASLANIKKLHLSKLDQLIIIFKKMSEIMKPHTQSSEKFLNRTIRELDRI